MEIREGIKYGYGRNHNNFAIIKQSLDNKNNFYAEFNSGGKCAEFSKKEWINDFQTGKLKLIEYPYKVGDWVIIIKDENGDYENTTVQITSFNSDNTAINYNSICKPEMYYGASFEAIRPAFKEEIPNYKQKVVKENYDYLIPILTKLDE